MDKNLLRTNQDKIKFISELMKKFISLRHFNFYSNIDMKYDLLYIQV